MLLMRCIYSVGGSAEFGTPTDDRGAFRVQPPALLLLRRGVSIDQVLLEPSPDCVPGNLFHVLYVPYQCV